MYMKHIKRDYILKSWVCPLGWTYGMGQRPKVNFFRIKSDGISNKRGWRVQQHGSKYFTRRLPILGGGVKIPLFQNMVMLHITLKGMANAVPCKQMFCPC